MSLASGVRLGSYEIVALIGVGGMGEVYKARDTRLDRTVAIKVLPADVGADPDASTLRGLQGRRGLGQPTAGSGSSRAKSRDERRRRFEQEARAVSALNHPHICVLFDVGESVPSNPESPWLNSVEGQAPNPESRVPTPASVSYLVMEYLDGQTLAERLTRGPLPLNTALEIGAQIADALSAAHKHGIVHRDLKPANVMLTRGGETASGTPHAKLLDFGLARLTQEAGAPGGGDTVTDATVPKGTAPYMSPEQIEGRETDARTDLFAFGAVLYEMLTGTRAFAGSSPASTMAAILEHEPRTASALQPGIPPALDRLIKRCLAKDPDARWQSAADLADELRWLSESGGGGANIPAATQSTPWRGVRLVIAITGAVVLVAAAMVLTWFIGSASTSKTVAGMSLDLRPAEIGPSAWSYTPGGSRTAFAWSGDGRTLVFSGIRGKGCQLYTRNIGDAVAQPLDGTEGAEQPVVSPDGRWVAFWAQRKIKRIPIGGGPIEVLASDLASPFGMAWDGANTLFIGKSEDGRIWSIGPGLAPKPVTTLLDGERRHALPSPLPGGRVLLYTVRRRGWSWGDEEVVAQTLANGTRKPLLIDAADARYVPSGHLVFLRRGTLMAVAFDAEKVEVPGTQEAMLDEVAQALTAAFDLKVTGAGQFAVAATGALAWIRSPVVEYPDTVLVTVDRRGQVTRLPAAPRPYCPSVRVSPDGRRLAVATQTSTLGGIWVYDLGRNPLTPVSMGGETELVTWSPNDGRRLVFDWLADGRRSLAWMPSDGSGKPQVIVPGALYPSSFTPDGRLAVAGGPLGVQLMAYENGQTRMEPLLETSEAPSHPEISKDGRWLAYVSPKTGRSEVYVRPFQGPGPAVPVSIDGGLNPAWNPNGRELFVQSIPDKEGKSVLMAFAFSPGTPPRIGRPKRLFPFDNQQLAFGCKPVRCYDVAPDGQKFYVVETDRLPIPPPVTHVNYIPNWLDTLKAKVPVHR